MTKTQLRQQINEFINSRDSSCPNEWYCAEQKLVADIMRDFSAWIELGRLDKDRENSQARHSRAKSLTAEQQNEILKSALHQIAWLREVGKSPTSTQVLECERCAMNALVATTNEGVEESFVNIFKTGDRVTAINWDGEKIECTVCSSISPFGRVLLSTGDDIVPHMVRHYSELTIIPTVVPVEDVTKMLESWNVWRL